MEKQRRENQKRNGAYAPFLLVAVVGILYHIKIQTMVGDDIFFGRATEGTTWLLYLAGRYEEWTSRIFIEGLLVLIIKYPLLWRVLDTLVFATFPLLLSQIFGGGRLMNWCAAGAVLLYPFHDMGSAGFITTTVNYFWPVWSAFYVGMLLKKMWTEERIRIPEAVFGIFACFLASSHEQVAVILCVVFLLLCFSLWKEKRKNNSMPVFIFLAAANLISIAAIALCPGNAARNKISVADLPVFGEYHFGDKLYLGLLSVERVFLANADIVFFTVAFILALLVYLKTGQYKKTLIACVPLFLLFGQTVLRTAYPGLSGIFVMPEQITEWSWTSLSTWLPMVYLAAAAASMLYAFYVILGENPFAYVSVVILLGLGFGVGMILGFMATIYVSGERVYIAFYFILLFAAMCCIRKMKERVQEKCKEPGGKLALTLLALVCLVNVGFVWLSC